eukprot:m.183380 g.183380  ORF g.183380 m.183380 type:complete len:63 (+) comp18078_c0_seq1:1673-1861(+)
MLLLFFRVCLMLMLVVLTVWFLIWFAFDCLISMLMLTFDVWGFVQVAEVSRLLFLFQCVSVP